jgi:hypothetical protein
VNLHEDIPREVNRVFVNQPSLLGGGGPYPLGPLGPLRPPRYFGLPMVNPGRPPLTLNKPYHWPLNYLEYVKDSDPNAHVRMLKVAIKAIMKQMMQNLLICSVLTLEVLCPTGVTIIWEITQIVLLQNYKWLFVKGPKI